MCELLGMNCNVPTDICFSFTGFQKRVEKRAYMPMAGASLFSRARECGYFWIQTFCTIAYC